MNEFNNVGDTLEINGLTVKLTCQSCPEQYDILKGTRKVGYIRFRYGQLRTEFYHKDTTKKIIHSLDFGGKHSWLGNFHNEEDRTSYLSNRTKQIQGLLQQGL